MYGRSSPDVPVKEARASVRFGFEKRSLETLFVSQLSRSANPPMPWCIFPTDWTASRKGGGAEPKFLTGVHLLLLSIGAPPSPTPSFLFKYIVLAYVLFKKRE